MPYNFVTTQHRVAKNKPLKYFRKDNVRKKWCIKISFEIHLIKFIFSLGNRIEFSVFGSFLLPS